MNELGQFSVSSIPPFYTLKQKNQFLNGDSEIRDIDNPSPYGNTRTDSCGTQIEQNR